MKRVFHVGFGESTCRDSAMMLLLGVYCQRRPPNYSQEQMPITSFNCRDKIIGGYYADPETDCQMFHVCVKVPGLGVQDFKFLCPNDTSFDQENQICDDWYNIDCESSTLFYSDNFDLYRLGSEASHKVRPGNVNNAVSDVEDDVYLQQRSDRGENVGKDLLRGSQSGNFFSNRGGREDEDINKEEIYKPKKKQVNKQPVRKLLTGKRPAPTQAAPSPTTEAYQQPQQQRGFGSNGHQGRNFRGNQQQFRTTEAPQITTERRRETEVYQRQRNNFYAPTTARANTPQEYVTSSTQRTEFFRTNFAQSQKTDSYPSSTTQKPYYNQNYNTPTTQKPYYNNQNYNAQPNNQNYNAQQNNQNYNTQQNNQNYNTQPNNQNFNSRSNNQNYNTQSTNQNYNTQSTNQNYNSQSTSQNYNVPTTHRPNYNQNYNNPTTLRPNYSQNYNTPTTLRPNYNQNYNTPTQKQENNFFNPSTTQNVPSTQKTYPQGTTYRPNYNIPVSTQSTTQKPNFYNNFNVNPTTQAPADYNYDQSQEKTNNQYETAKLYKINLNAAINAQNNDRYDEPKDEFLKTAPSQNLAASAFNRVQNAYKGYNTSVSSSYNFESTAKPAANFNTGKSSQNFNSAKTSPSYNTAKPSQSYNTAKPPSSFNPKPTTNYNANPTTNYNFASSPKPAQGAPSRGRATYAQTTDATEKPRPFTTPTPIVSKKDHDQYDYAYYDDGTASEYENVENVEEFSRTTSRKRSA